jgi:hypothetical protein
MSNTTMTLRLWAQRGKSFLAIFVRQVLLVLTTPPKFFARSYCHPKM